jgi:membrane fusion protein (multidrug efflux system)
MQYPPNNTDLRPGGFSRYCTGCFLFLMLLTLLLAVPQMSLAQKGNSQPVEVIAQTVRLQKIVDEVEALGTLQANESVELTASVTELVTKVDFDDGQRVNKGDVLLEMDMAEELAQLAEERSVEKEASRQLARVKSLTQKGVSSEATLDERQRLYAAAKARIAAIESRIAQRRIVAPFDGVVGIRDISAGALVQPGTVITTLDDDAVMKLDFSVPSVFLTSLKPGTTMEATARAFEKERFQGTIKSVDSRVDPITRSIKVRAILPNADRKLRPGLLMQVLLQKNPRQALVVAEEAVIVNGDEHYVMKIIPQEGGTGQMVEKQKVTIGTRRPGEVEILEGLSAGDQIVTHGHVKLRPGAPVTLAEDNR